jgi:hypothetical protein
MNDPTESTRRELVAEINNGPKTREELEALYGKVYDTNQLGEFFSVQGFMAPFVVVKEKATGQVGCLTFQHNPRFYFDFVAD